MKEAFNKGLMQVTVVAALPAESKEEGAGNASVVAKLVCDALGAVAAGCKSETEDKKFKLCVNLLQPCHHPVVACVQPNAWPRLVKALGLEPATAVEESWEALLEAATASLKGSKSGELSISTLVEANPEVAVPALVALLDRSLKGNDLNVSAEDYETFLAPASEVFDKRVLNAILQNEKDAAASMNVKRESKAYSYKDQMEEIALRKELEEKRRK